MSVETHTNRDRDDGTLNEVLQMDEAVEELTDLQVMDVYVRGKFTRMILDGNSPRYMHTDDFQRAKKMLKDARGEALKEVAIAESYDGRHSELARSLGWENGGGNVKTLFDRWTKDDHPNPVEAARVKIKEALRCSGMARVEVMRHRVKTHTEHPDQLTE